jgi:hypothetical protein
MRVLGFTEQMRDFLCAPDAVISTTGEIPSVLARLCGSALGRLPRAAELTVKLAGGELDGTPPSMTCDRGAAASVAVASA